MKSTPKFWLGLATMVVSLSVLILLGLDRIGIGPNLGLPFGYYGQFNRVLARVEANPELEVIQTKLHRDLALEDFYITVRTQDDMLRTIDTISLEFTNIGRINAPFEPV